jgi:MFS family permease
MVYPIIPLFLTGTLGAPVLAVGIIEGIAESTASLLKFVFGWLSDKFRRRVPFTVAGYGIAALAKPGLALAFAWPAVLFMRFLDRAGKGIRTAPRQKRLATFVQADMDGPLTNRRRMTAVRSIQLGSLQRSHEISRRKTVAPFTLDPVLSHRVALR